MALLRELLRIQLHRSNQSIFAKISNQSSKGRAGRKAGRKRQPQGRIEKDNEQTAFQLYVKASEETVAANEELVSMFITAEKNGYKTVPEKLSAHLKEQATAFSYLEKATARPELGFQVQPLSKSSALDLEKFLYTLNTYMSETRMQQGNPSEQLRRYKNIFQVIQHFEEAKDGFVLIAVANFLEITMVEHGQAFCSSNNAELCAEFTQLVRLHLKQRPNVSILLQAEADSFERALDEFRKDKATGENLKNETLKQIIIRARSLHQELTALRKAALQSSADDDWTKVRTFIVGTASKQKALVKRLSDVMKANTDKSQLQKTPGGVQSVPSSVELMAYKIFSLHYQSIKSIVDDYNEAKTKLETFAARK